MAELTTDLIYADSYGHELGAISGAVGDFAIGKENTWQLKIPPDLGVAEGWYLMLDGEEYGGIVDDVSIDTTKDYITVGGRTWHGIMQHEIIEPPSGQSHYTVSGDCNQVLGSLVEKLGLGYCMAAEKEPSGLTVTNYRFERYVDGYNGARAMLRSTGAKLRIRYDGAKRKAVLYAAARGEYIDDGIDGDRTQFVITRKRPVNHMIGLGKGELTACIVVHRYADDEGHISDTQTLFGAEHSAEKYESPNSERPELLDAVDKRLADLQTKRYTCRLQGATSGLYDIDDIVGGTSTKHGVTVVTTIAKKIATLTGRSIKYETKTDTEVR